MWILRGGISSKGFIVIFLEKFEVGKATVLLFLLQVFCNKAGVETILFG